MRLMMEYYAAFKNSVLKILTMQENAYNKVLSGKKDPKQILTLFKMVYLGTRE